jgi:hypothetical protein
VFCYYRSEIITNLLEAKLQSIPESALESSPLTTTPQSEQQPQSQPQQQPSDMKTVKDDPRYVKYFKMLKVGIPIDHIQQQMMFDGVDPNILSNPDAAPPINSRMFGSYTCTLNTHTHILSLLCMCCVSVYIIEENVIFFLL